MKVRCDRNELAERLQSVAAIVLATPTTKPILQDFLIRGADDRLEVEATDLDIGARVTIDRVDVEEPGQVALSASRFLSLVREIPSSTVLLESTEDGSGSYLRAEGYEFKLLGDDPAEFPEVRRFDDAGALKVSREVLAEMFRRVGVAACRDTSRFQLTGIFMEVEGDRLTMTATDGKRLTNDFLRIENAAGSSVCGIVPNRAVDVIAKVLSSGEETVQLSILETEIQVSFGFGQLMARLIEGTYPDYRTALPTEKKTRISAKRSDLFAAVRSASFVTDRETATIVFRLEGDTLFLESRASNIGESKIQVPVSLEGEPLEIRFNPVYFIDALRTVNEEQIRMEFSGADRPGTMRGGANYRHFLMPLVVG